MTRRVRVLGGEDAGRIGFVLDPDPAYAVVPPGVPGIELVTGKPGHLIVMLDAEAGEIATRPGQVARGGRGGKRVLLPDAAVADLGSDRDPFIGAATVVATAQIKAEHDRAFVECQKLVTNAIIVAGAHVKEGLIIESQQLYLGRLRALRKLIADFYTSPMD